MESKICSYCGKTKNYSEFTKRSHNKSGIAAHCKECARILARKRYTENKELCNAKSKEWKKANPDAVRRYTRQWQSLNRDHISSYNTEYSSRNIEKIKAYRKKNKDQIAIRAKEYRQKKKDFLKIAAKAWHEAHPNYKIESLRKWRAENPEKNKELLRRANKKRAGILKYKVSDNISRRISESLKKGTKSNRHWETLVDFTVEQLKSHIEKLFQPGMTWENYGTVWEIDHKIPIAVFNFEDPDHIDFRLCWSLKNLQPLERLKNRSKGAKIDKPFQQSLPLKMAITNK